MFSQVTKIEEMKEKKAPVDWVSNSPNFSTVGAYGYQPKLAASGRSAFAVDFVLSDQGQRILGRTGKAARCAGACRLSPRASINCWRAVTCTRLRMQRDSRSTRRFIAS